MAVREAVHLACAPNSQGFALEGCSQMKKIALSLVLVSGLALAACSKPAEETTEAAPTDEMAPAAEAAPADAMAPAADAAATDAAAPAADAAAPAADAAAPAAEAAPAEGK